MTDRTLQIWERLSYMSDKIIEESMIPAQAAPAAAKRTREKGRFSAFMNHPAMVAVLCAVVSLGVVAAIVMAGRGGPDVPPVVGTSHVEETETLNLEGLDYTAEIQSPSYALTDETLDFTLTSTKPGVILYWRNNFTLYLVEGEEEFLVYQYEGNVTYEGSGYASSENEYATATGCITMHSIHAYQKAHGAPPLKAGRYRLYFDEKAYDRRVFAEVTLTEAETMSDDPETRYEPTEQVRDYTLIPHTPTAGINDKYFKISMTATEPGKVLTAAASYRLYRLHGDEEELIHDYDVELAVYEEPASPDAYAVYETGVSLVWAKSNLEAKGDTLTPGWYRVKFGRATLDFELVDKTGATPEVHPFAELPVPETVYTSLSTEDMALMEQYERIYTSAYKIEKLWAFFTKLTVTEASPPEHIRSGDGLGIHVTYPDGTKGRIFFWGEQHEYFYIDDGPWYQAPPEEVAALMAQIKNTPSDPT